MQRLGVKDELAALGLGDGCHHGHLATKLVGRARFALTNALDLGRMKRIELPAALPLALVAHLIGAG